MVKRDIKNYLLILIITNLFFLIQKRDIVHWFLYLAFLNHVLHLCMGYIVTGSKKCRGNQYIQLVTVLFFKSHRPMTSNYQLSQFRSGQDPNSNLRGGRQVCNHYVSGANILYWKYNDIVLQVTSIIAN